MKDLHPKGLASPLCPRTWQIHLCGPSARKLYIVKVAQSCPTLCDLVGYTVLGILQARILEWVPFPFYRESSRPRERTQVSHIAGGFFTRWATREAQESEMWINLWSARRACLSCKHTRHEDNFEFHEEIKADFSSQRCAEWDVPLEMRRYGIPHPALFPTGFLIEIRCLIFKC